MSITQWIYPTIVGTFVMLKVVDALDWSWWWLLMPIVPDLWFVFDRLGLL